MIPFDERAQCLLRELRTARRLGYVLAMCGCACAACNTNAGPAVSVSEHILDNPVAVVSVESGVLASPRDIVLDSSGDLYILDQIDKSVIVVTPTGQVRATIGRPGSGPGEFSAPLALGLDAQHRVRVFDFQRGSVQVFSNEGMYLDAYRTDIAGIPSRFSFGKNATIAYSGTRVVDKGGLVALLDSTGKEMGVVGTLRTTETAIPANMLEELHQRRLPSFMRNNVLPAMDAHGGVWVFLQADALLQHFLPDGSADVEVVVNVPEMASILEAFYDWYSTVDAPDLLRFFEYVEHAVVTNQTLWLLWSTPVDRPGLVTVHDSTGTIISRLVLRGIEADSASADSRGGPARRRIAIDPARSRLYLSDQKALALLAFSLPDDIVRSVR